MANLLELLTDGWHEIGRRAQRFNLRRVLAAADKRRARALTQLGQTAWQSKVDLSEFAELRSQLEQLDARAGELSATTARLDTERTEVQARRQAEANRFDALLAAARDAKSQAETARLEAERKAALQPIDAELDKLRQASAAAARDDATARQDRSALFLELGAALFQRRAADPALAAGIEAVDAVDAERATVQPQIDASLVQTGAMPSGTMARFGALVLVPVLVVVAGYGVYGRVGSPRPDVSLQARATRTTIAPPAAPVVAARSQVAVDEKRKDDAVGAYLNARSDANLRKAAIEILKADVIALGSAADRSSLPLLLAVLERGEPELRAAAANAVGMIGPTAADTPVLVKAFNDPIPAVRQAMLPVLERMQDPGARLLAQRVRSAARAGEEPKLSAFEPTLAPDAARLGAAVYPGATFLAFASDLEIGRAAFSSADPVQKVVDHYASSAAGRPPIGAQEFSRLYFGGTASDPSGANAISEEMQAWFRQAVVSGMSEAEMQPEVSRRVRRMMDMPMLRYADGALYGEPVFIATDVAEVAGKTRVVRYVVVFQDHSLGRTGFEYHTADATRK
jgi:hypothetical protein